MKVTVNLEYKADSVTLAVLQVLSALDEAGSADAVLTVAAEVFEDDDHGGDEQLHVPDWSDHVPMHPSDTPDARTKRREQIARLTGTRVSSGVRHPD